MSRNVIDKFTDDKAKREGPHRSSDRAGAIRGDKYAWLVVMLLFPAFFACYNGAIDKTANESPPPGIEGSQVAGIQTQDDSRSPTPVANTTPSPSTESTQESAQPTTPSGAAGSSPDAAGTMPDAATDAATDPDPDQSQAGVIDASSGSTSEVGPAETTDPSGAGFTGVAYITIDDGPSRSITPGMLDVLMEKGVPATFFVLPHSNVDDLYIRMIDEGHEIGNHSFSHNYARLYQAGNIRAFREDVLDAHEFMMTNFGYVTTSYRFPGGSIGRSVSIVAPRQEILDELGYRYYNWHIDIGDARSDLPDRRAVTLANNVLNNTRGRAHVIILMHDSAGKGTTLQALPMIIDGLREQGYTFDVLRNYPPGKPP